MSIPMAQEVAAKANFFRRAGARIADYAKNVAADYADVGRGVLTDTKTRPFRSAVVFALLGGAGYAIATNPKELEFRDRLCALRQQMALVPKDIHSFDGRAGIADGKLAELTTLLNTERLDYYDCWFFSLLVKRDWDRHVNSPASQDSNLKEWPWQTLRRNIVDVGAFRRFFQLEKAFLNYDVREEEFKDLSLPSSS
ncbi:hypothetical protein M3Y99_00048900 [Aphelenchoides fujianensis]|nr:hypothetical protein M3Y99_00048900 [Aphelenchoides fujianensis]